MNLHNVQVYSRVDTTGILGTHYIILLYIM